MYQIMIGKDDITKFNSSLNFDKIDGAFDATNNENINDQLIT